MFKQLQYFAKDYIRAAGKNKMRLLFIWMSWGIVGLFFYRLERSLYLMMGKPYKYLRVLFLPILNLVQAISRLDIPYTADIGPGIIILHPVMGITINGSSIIGNNLTLTGGNILGLRHLPPTPTHITHQPQSINKLSDDRQFVQLSQALVLGDNVNVGANASIIGPLTIGDNVVIAAMACVVKNVPSNCTLMVVPAKIQK